MLKMTPILTFCKIIKELTVNEIHFYLLYLNTKLILYLIKFYVNTIYNNFKI